MEADKRYFFEGLFIVVFSAAMAFLFVWLAGPGHRDDVFYRIYFSESVSGLARGDPVKYRGVDVGTVDAMAIDPDDPRRVRVDVRLRKDTPVKTDTKATLKWKGITGVVFVELDGGSPQAGSLLAATAPGQIPEIPTEKSSIANILETLPKAISRFTALEGQAKKVLTDVGEVTAKVKENPSLLLRRPKEKTSPDAK
jgi:phospholipid/cholesterol/gamma-HCH transport system substrate-binding protein